MCAAVQRRQHRSVLGDYSVTTWTETEGLPAASIRVLEQGAEGALWLGTDTGLVRFDGLRFVPFEQLNQGRLPSGAVGALLHPRDGGLWVGLNGPRSLARIQRGAVTLCRRGRRRARLARSTTLYQDAAGTIYARLAEQA